MSDELRAALDALSPDERRRFSRAATLAIVAILEGLKKGGQPAEDTEDHDEDPS